MQNLRQNLHIDSGRLMGEREEETLYNELRESLDKLSYEKQMILHAVEFVPHTIREIVFPYFHPSL